MHTKLYTLQWKPELDHRILCIDLKCGERPKHVASNLDMNRSYLCLDFKRAPIYADMVDQMLCTTTHEEIPTL